MPGLISGLAGAGGAVNNTNSYYNDALQKIVSSTGSPSAQIFGRELQAAEQPGNVQSQQGLLGTLAANGITNSGAGKADLSNLFANQSAQLASGIAPMYQNAQTSYDNLVSQQPQADQQSYNNAIQQFYQALQSGGQVAGEFLGGGIGGGTAAPNTAASSTTEYTTSNPYGT